MQRSLGLTALAVLSLIASQVWADVIGARTQTTPLVVGDDEACATVTLVPTTGASTSMPFVAVADNQRVVVTFTAECSVKAPNTSTWLNIDILIDGVEAPPSQTTDNAFCTSRGNNVLDGWVSASLSVVFVVPAPGLHNVVVRGSLVGCSDATDDQWRIDDATTVIQANL
jgi:hypothetical protein